MQGLFSTQTLSPIGMVCTTSSPGLQLVPPANVVESLHSAGDSTQLANSIGYSTRSMTFDSNVPKLLSLGSVSSTTGEL